MNCVLFCIPESLAPDTTGIRVMNPSAGAFKQKQACKTNKQNRGVMSPDLWVGATSAAGKASQEISPDLGGTRPGSEDIPITACTSILFEQLFLG